MELGLLICMVEAMFVSKDNNFRTDLQEKSYTVDVYTLCMCKSILVLVVTVLIDLSVCVCFFFLNGGRKNNFCEETLDPRVREGI